MIGTKDVNQGKSSKKLVYRSLKLKKSGKKGVKGVSFPLSSIFEPIGPFFSTHILGKV